MTNKNKKRAAILVLLVGVAYWWYTKDKETGAGNAESAGGSGGSGGAMGIGPMGDVGKPTDTPESDKIAAEKKAAEAKAAEEAAKAKAIADAAKAKLENVVIMSDNGGMVATGSGVVDSPAGPTGTGGLGSSMGNGGTTVISGGLGTLNKILGIGTSSGLGTIQGASYASFVNGSKALTLNQFTKPFTKFYN